MSSLLWQEDARFPRKPEGVPVTSPRAPRARWRMAIPALVGILCVVSWGSFYVGYFNDDVIYIELARALGTGAGYHDIAFPGAPVHLKYPPLFPLLLMPMQAMRPDAVGALQIVGLLCAIAGVALFLVLLADERPSMRWAPALLLACNPFLIRYAGTVLTDVPFMAMVLLYLVAARPLFDGVPTGARAARLGLIAAACFYLRSVGAILVPATLLAMLVHRRGWRAAAACVGVFAAAVAPYMLGRGLLGYQGDVVTNYEATPWSTIIGRNLELYLPGLPVSIWGDPIHWLQWLAEPWGAWLWAPVAITWIVLGIGFAVRELPRPSLAGVLLAIYTVLFVFWPYPDIRFFLPVFPLLLLYACAGVDAVAARLAPARRDAVVGAGAALMAAWLVGVSIYGATHPATEERDAPRETYAWVQAHVPATATMKVRGAALWLYTGRLIDYLGSFPGTPEGGVRALLQNGSEWILLRDGAAPDACGPEWMATVVGRPGMFERAYANSAENAVVFRVVGDRDRFLRAYDAFVRGVQLAQAERLDESRAALRECLALEADFPPAEFNLALLTWRAGNAAEARRLLEALLQRHPDHAKARALLEQVQSGKR